MPELSITTLDLFAGAGGLTAGLRRASSRFSTVRAVEHDVAAAATFDANHGAGLAYAGGIETWLAEDHVPEVDLVIGGPPCQGFSALNRNKVGVERNQLWERYAETIALARPKWFVLENVPTFMKAPEFDQFLASTEPRGALREWTVDVRVLIAADYGSPQLRRRAVVIGHRTDMPRPGWPQPTHLPPRRLTVGDALADLTPEVSCTSLPDRVIKFAGYCLPGEFLTSELHFTRSYTDKSLLRFGHIPPGGNRFDLPWELQTPCWRKHRTGSGDVMGRLVWDRPSVTIRTEFFKPEKGRYLHPSEHRAITHQEAARIQGFPDDYRWVGSKTEIARQIGNAVPLPMGAAIGTSLLRAADLAAGRLTPASAADFELALSP